MAISTAFGYLNRISPLYIAVFLMRFSFAFTVVALQFIIPNEADRGIISAAYPVTEMLTASFFGLLADRIGRKLLVVGGLIASSAITLSFTFTRSVPIYVVIHGLQGICAAAIVTSTLALLTDVAKVKSRGREMGAYDFCTISGYAFGVVFGFLLMGRSVLSANNPFYAGSSIALIAGLVSIPLLKDPKRNLSHSTTSLKANMKKLISNRSAISLIPTWFVLMMLVGVGLTFTREILSTLSSRVPLFGGLGQTHVQVTSSAIVALILVGGVALGFSQTSFGSLSDRFGRKRVVLAGQISIALLLAILVGIFGFGLSELIAIPLFVLCGAGVLAFTPAGLAELADVAPETGKGSAMGFYSLTVGAGTVFGPLGGGLLIAKFGPPVGLSLLFSIGVIIMIGVLALEASSIDVRKNI